MNRARRLLVVEDDAEVTDLLGLYLGDRGYQVEGVHTGEEALARALETFPHAILLDITLPDIDGFEVCSRLRRQPRTAHIPIMFLTKRDKRSERLAGLRIGADDYITKPFDLEELSLRIRNLIARVERENLVDPMTGLPGEKLAREYMDRARRLPHRVVLRLCLRHAEAFREVYGPLAFGDVRVYLAHLILSAVNADGRPQDFVGALGQECFVVICAPGAASAIGERVTSRFNTAAGKHYTEADRVRGYVEVGGVRSPIMHLDFTIIAGEDAPAAPQP